MVTTHGLATVPTYFPFWFCLSTKQQCSLHVHLTDTICGEEVSCCIYVERSEKFLYLRVLYVSLNYVSIEPQITT